MAISRPFLLAVLGVILLGATVLAVQNARDTTDNASTPAVVQSEAAPAPAQQTAATDAADTLKAAFDLSDVKSGRFAAKLTFSAGKTANGIGVTGAFDRSAEDAPRFAVAARLGAAKSAPTGGLVSLGDKAYFVRGDDGWRVPAQVWGPVAKGSSPLAIHPQNWVRDLKSEGTESVGGLQTEHISGRIDPQAMFNELAGPLGGGAKAVKAAQPKVAKFDVWVGKRDHVMRRVTAELVFPKRARFQADVRLSDINKPQRIKAPEHVRAGAPSGALGAFAGAAVGRINGATDTDTPSLEALSSPNPGRAARAVAQHRKVVILFTNKRGLDDRRMVAVVRDVDRRTNALVLTDPVDAVDRYGKLIQDLGVSETPSVVIIGASGKAKLLEGYYDSDTLTQAVSDAR
jgi:hypothetical protein